MKKEIRIKNKKGKTIYAVIEWKSKKPGPLVVLCHGYRSFGGTPQVAKVARALREKGFTTVRLDATNSTGKSSGKLVDFTVGGYVQDIKQVVSHTLKYLNQKQYILVGYSIGGTAVTVIASRDRRISRLILQSPTYDVPAVFEMRDNFTLLLKQGWAFEYSTIQKKQVKIGIAVYNEARKYDMPKYVSKIECPVLMVYGSAEDPRILKLNRKFYSDLNTKIKNKLVIKGAGHTLHQDKDSKRLADGIIKWLNQKDK
ncbi:MAG: alpha/beta fold hydrolase [Patescibacteria group bacterium]|jgi:alpha-beta hydrolase superfamily lysophospholipase